MDNTKNNSEAFNEELTDILDSPITIGEVEEILKRAKKGKAVAEDLIPNEFLKASNPQMLKAITHLFNECLRLGAYPWNTSNVTPLHKKGCTYDPNNYRAIAVSSNIGKLFSSILLERLVRYKSLVKPDTPNQLGFCKEAQTSDHILTLSTCIDKYINVNKGRLYTCFVDFAKAFDTVCREALLYKMWLLGIQGKFFKCLEHMYSNSTAKIKLLNKLSQEIDVLVGTEQGHPMSPELFKSYIHDLSEALNSEDCLTPMLDSTCISHLLWADDLVLLALEPQSLQKLIDVLCNYCTEWGLSVNISKTAVMVFNRSGRLLKESRQFVYGEIEITSAREYCYLGIIFKLTGSFVSAQKQLKQKGMRAYFSLKSLIDFKAMKKNILFKLFDALVLPVATYGCQIWASESSLFKEFTAAPHEMLTNLAKDPVELLYLSFLKWTMGVGKRTSNAAVWGDCGRAPVIITMLKQIFSYVNRLICLHQEDSQSLVTLAYREQQKLGLKWYKGISSMFYEATQRRLDERQLIAPQQIRQSIEEKYVQVWDQERRSNRKLGFYNSIKEKFGLESYLTDVPKHKELISLARLRSSSHKLRIETGRYKTNRTKPVERACLFCTDISQAELLGELPYFEPIIEDEVHVLRTCPAYHDLRSNLSDEMKTKLFTDLTLAFYHTALMGSYIRKIFNRRFPKKRKSSDKVSPKILE